jgi:hypothetical protein
MDYFVLCEKLTNVFDYIKSIYKNTFDNVDLIVTPEENDKSRYSYEYDDITGDVRNQCITICLEEYDEYHDFQTRYYNKVFDMKLEHNYYTVLIRMLLHECGHHFNIDYYKDRDDEYFESLMWIDKYYEWGTEDYEQAYREIDEEHAADKFAADFMKIHIEKCINIMNQEVVF